MSDLISAGLKLSLNFEEASPKQSKKKAHDVRRKRGEFAKRKSIGPKRMKKDKERERKKKKEKRRDPRNKKAGVALRAKYPHYSPSLSLFPLLLYIIYRPWVYCLAQVPIQFGLRSLQVIIQEEVVRPDVLRLYS